jgi:hypothetical protein
MHDDRKKESCAPHFSSIKEIGSSARHFSTSSEKKIRTLKPKHKLVMPERLHLGNRHHKVEQGNKDHVH